MDKQPTFENLLSVYWQQPAANIAEWKQIFQQQQQNKKLLLQQILQRLPATLGDLEFLEDKPGEQFIVLFTYDEESDDGRANAADIFATLTETRAITFFCTEAAWKNVDIEWLRVFPDATVRRQFARSELLNYKFTPLECAGIMCSEPVTIWGIEDEEIYRQVLKAYQSNSPKYWSMIDHRAKVMFKNLLAKIQQLGINIVGVSLTSANYADFHSWLQEKGIAHAGIRSVSTTRSTTWDLDAALKGKLVDEFSATLQLLFDPNLLETMAPKKGNWLTRFFRRFRRR